MLDSSARRRTFGGMFTASVLLSLVAGCGTGGAGTEAANGSGDEVPETSQGGPESELADGGASEERDDSTPPAEVDDPGVTVEARWYEPLSSQAYIEYSLTNSDDVELIALDASRSLQIERLADGRVRLFKGKQDTGTTSFYETPTRARPDAVWR